MPRLKVIFFLSQIFFLCWRVCYVISNVISTPGRGISKEVGTVRNETLNACQKELAYPPELLSKIRFPIKQLCNVNFFCVYVYTRLQGSHRLVHFSSFTRYKSRAKQVRRLVFCHPIKQPSQWGTTRARFQTLEANAPQQSRYTKPSWHQFHGFHCLTAVTAL